MRTIIDNAGEEQEIAEDESVLVLGGTGECAREWMRGQGLPPHGRQFKVMPSPRALEGYRPQTIVVLDCFGPEAYVKHAQLRKVVARSVMKSSRGVRWIDGACR